MAHLHSVYDSDMHFVIDPKTRKIRNESEKNSLVQFDHNSERFTFQIPRFVEEHDMALCDKVEVHYINVGSNKEHNEDVYEVNDAQVSPDDGGVVIFSWLVSGNATQLAGGLSFLVRFSCFSEDSTLEYAWHTDTFTDIKILSGMNNGEAVVAEYSDILEHWRSQVTCTRKGVNSFTCERVSDSVGGDRWQFKLALENGWLYFVDIPIDDTSTFLATMNRDPTTADEDTKYRLWVNASTGVIFVRVDGNSGGIYIPGLYKWIPVSGGGGNGSTESKNVDIHADYFEITRDGVLALKPEYRGANTRSDYPCADSDNGSGVAGSKNAELPEHLVIPETVNGTAVDRLADGIFLFNNAVRDVTFPSCVDDIPERCFDNCSNLHNLYNTDHVKSIGKTAFQSSSIYRANFPNLETFGGISVFQNCGRLMYADVGGVTSLPDKTFNACVSLSKVKSHKKITSVGERAFSITGNLVNLDFVSNLANIGKGAFLSTRFDYDWNSLTGCTFGTDATQKQFNPTDFWSACTFTTCENPLPTQLTQDNPLWAKREIGSSGVLYEEGCGLFSTMHAYCGLHNISVTSVTELENIINTNYPNLLNTYSKLVSHNKVFAQGLELTVETYTRFDQTVLQAVYNALAAGKYVSLGLTGISYSLSHAVLVYGVNEYGELLVIDSAARYKDDTSKVARYTIPYKNLCGYMSGGIDMVRILSL